MQKLFIMIGVFFFGVTTVMFLNFDEGDSPIPAIFFALLGVVFLVIASIPEIRQKYLDAKAAERMEQARRDQKSHVARRLYEDCERQGITELTDENREEALKVGMNYAIGQYRDLESYFYLGKRIMEKRREYEKGRANNK